MIWETEWREAEWRVKRKNKLEKVACGRRFKQRSRKRLHP